MNVFLTGASSGIGLATAKLLTENRCEVWGTSRDPARLPKLPGFHPVALDLLHPILPPDVPFDVLINNAGSGVFGPLETLPADLVREQLQVLVEAPLELIRLALPGMRAHGRGLIINVTSLGAAFPIPFMAPYSAAKAALSAFTRALRVELADTPIRVVELRPGDINTPFHKGTKRVSETDRAKLVWDAEQRHMAGAPPPELVACAVWRLINAAHPPPVLVVGGFFQARLAPLGARLLPLRLQEYLLRRYYGI